MSARFASTEMSTNATSQTTKKHQPVELPPNMVKKWLPSRSGSLVLNRDGRYAYDTTLLISPILIPILTYSIDTWFLATQIQYLAHVMYFSRQVKW